MLDAAERARMEDVRRRYTVLSECLTIIMALQRRVSKNEANMEPKEGYERVFDEDRKRADVLRSMMRELRDEEDALRRKEYNVKKE